ncbi:MAG TPA: hypothetical protein VKR52_00745 [Terracidiphilus sp.]|nr:hypothetical protein [Terracidiphilus sp.]
MTGNRQRNAWVWLAVAAISVATLARAQAGAPNAPFYSNPVLQFLSSHANADRLAATGVQASAHETRNLSRGISYGPLLAMLPVFFIGLVAPLNLVSAQAVLCLGHRFSAPAPPFLFQRPPPLFLA